MPRPSIILWLLFVCVPICAAENTKDPERDGPSKGGWLTAEIPDSTKDGEKLAAAIYYPAEAAEEKSAPADAKKPWPVLIFSPGGPAPSYNGYEDIASRLASWGVVTVLVAFGDRSAEKRAPQFAVVRDWLEKKNAEEGFALKGKLDMKTVLCGGHSRGAAAAVLAAAERKFVGCVAIGPALDKLPAGYTTATLLIGSPEDSGACNALYKSMKTPRWMYIVAGMDHFMKPAAKRAIVLRYVTVWVTVRALMKDEFKSRLSGPEPRREKENGVLAEMKVEE
jgi:hypothetical protein